MSMISRQKLIEDIDNKVAGLTNIQIMQIADIINSQPPAECVPLSEVYRVIAGHSDYHGDNILAALTCIAAGKEVKPVKPLPAESPVGIDRQKLIEEVKKVLNRDSIGLNDKWNLAIARVIKIINSQPPADQWIPCSERLPEEDTYVLICSGEIVHEACFEDGHFSNDYGMWYKAIEYWMPLPEPYKGEQNDR